ncbi:YaaA family protein [bacterium]|nr:YaaA family protein [bacterium]
MILYITPCCREKSDAPGDIPALERYLSRRIRAVHQHAARAGAEFRIFSGMFGLLRAEDSLPYYDKRLEPTEVPAMVELLAKQLAELDPEKVLYFAPGPDGDPGGVPYRDSIARACKRAGVELLQPPPPALDCS